METLTTWMGSGLDVVTVLLLTAVLWRLGRDSGGAAATWDEREARLQTIFDELRGLVAQSEGLARDLDAKLAQREERLEALLATGESAVQSGASADARQAPRRERGIELRDEPAAAAEPALTAQRIEALAETGTPVEEIARRMGVAPAEVRLVIGLKSARLARQRAAEERPHA